MSRNITSWTDLSAIRPVDSVVKMAFKPTTVSCRHLPRPRPDTIPSLQALLTHRSQTARFPLHLPPALDSARPVSRFLARPGSASGPVSGRSTPKKSATPDNS